jgi:hypothetical protein
LLYSIYSYTMSEEVVTYLSQWSSLWSFRPKMTLFIPRPWRNPAYHWPLQIPGYLFTFNQTLRTFSLLKVPLLVYICLYILVKSL